MEKQQWILNIPSDGCLGGLYSTIIDKPGVSTLVGGSLCPGMFLQKEDLNIGLLTKREYTFKM